MLIPIFIYQQANKKNCGLPDKDNMVSLEESYIQNIPEPPPLFQHERSRTKLKLSKRGPPWHQHRILQLNLSKSGIKFTVTRTVSYGQIQTR